MRVGMTSHTPWFWIPELAETASIFAVANLNSCCVGMPLSYVLSTNLCETKVSHGMCHCEAVTAEIGQTASC